MRQNFEVLIKISMIRDEVESIFALLLGQSPTSPYTPYRRNITFAGLMIRYDRNFLISSTFPILSPCNGRWAICVSKFASGLGQLLSNNTEL